LPSSSSGFRGATSRAVQQCSTRAERPAETLRYDPRYTLPVEPYEQARGPKVSGSRRRHGHAKRGDGSSRGRSPLAPTCCRCRRVRPRTPIRRPGNPAPPSRRVPRARRLAVPRSPRSDSTRPCRRRRERQPADGHRPEAHARRGRPARRRLTSSEALIPATKVRLDPV
jgi:hypothetical protein